MLSKPCSRDIAVNSVCWVRKCVFESTPYTCRPSAHFREIVPPSVGVAVGRPDYPGVGAEGDETKQKSEKSLNVPSLLFLSAPFAARPVALHRTGSRTGSNKEAS